MNEPTRYFIFSYEKINIPNIDVTYLIICFTKVISRGRTPPKAIIPTTYFEFIVHILCE